MQLMTSLGGVVLASVFLIAASAPPSGQLSGVNQSSNANAVPNRRVHTVGDVWMSIGSDGEVGGQYGAYGADPDSIAEIESSFEFPGGSHREHLYGSGLWIGGLVGGVDTVVMSAMFAGSGPNPVFTPTKPMETYYDSARGHQYFVAQYADTAMNVNRYPADRSLGVEVCQTSHAFASRPYDRFVIVEYLIRNISRQTIYKAHVGFFADPDVFHELRSGQPEGEASDDITGFLRERGIAYTIDNDGDAASVSDSLFSRNWCPNGFGLAPIMMDPLPRCTSFNWWATNFGNTEWGPTRTIPNYNSTSVGEPVIPGNMPQMYRAMANREIDFDQIEATIDKRDEGWNRPHIAGAQNVANGLDTRWVLSYCFGNLAPFDSLRIVMAYVIGDSIHTTPGRYPDPYNPGTFAAGLDFTDLRRNVDLARWAWGHDFDLNLAAPVNVSVSPIRDDALTISWSAAPFTGVTKYRVLRRESGSSEWTNVVEVHAGDLSYTDGGLMVGSDLEYSVSAIDSDGGVSPPATAVGFKVGSPAVAPTLAVTTAGPAVAIDWQIPDAETSLAPLRHLQLFRRTSHDPAFTLHATLPLRGPNATSAGASVTRTRFGMNENDFVDGTSESGVQYYYAARVVNALGLAGPLSRVTSITPMPLDRRGIIFFHSFTYFGEPLINREDQVSFYGMWASEHGFDTTELSRRPQAEVDSLVSLRHLSKYQCVIFVGEDRYGYSPAGVRIGVLESYSRLGGACIFVTRNHGMSTLGPPYYPHESIRRLCGISSCQKEFAPADLEFRVAKSTNLDYSDIEGDSSLGWSFENLRNAVMGKTFDYPAGFIPIVGTIGGIYAGTEVLYEYESLKPGSTYHGKPIAVRRITDSSAAILFNFPLSLMKHEQAWQALTRAVADLGIDTVNYWLPATSTTRSMIEWLYGRSAGAPDPAWDVNHDGVIDIRDVVEELDR